MGKIKINLVSGTSLEKPLITCFKGTNANYLVLDNEANGSMGLPIIIISKLNGTNLEKIIDPNEWGAVKENLKTIIGGTALPYLSVPETLNAPDDFFTQLTLPVASYDLLKSVYAPPAPEPEPVAEQQASVQESAPAQTPVVEAPTEPKAEAPAEITLAPIPEVPAATPTIETPAASVEAPISAPATNQETTAVPMEPSANEVSAPAAQAVPTMPVDIPSQVESTENGTIPQNEPSPVENVASSTSSASEMSAPVDSATTSVQEPVAAPATESTNITPEASAPAIDLPVSQTSTTEDPDIKIIKETFMKSCENMFEALMKKFENKN